MLGGAPTPEIWSRFLGLINDHYRNTEEDRLLLLRSNELASTEVDEARKRLGAQRESIRAALSTMADALGIFGRIAFGDDTSGSGLPSLEAATEDATRRLQALFSDTHFDDSSAELTGVRTNLVRLAEALGRLMNEAREKVRLQREVSSAELAQSFLTPSEELLDAGAIQVVGASIPLSGCGGDWWQVAALPSGNVVTLVGDVTGHGIASSVIAGVARAASHVGLERGVTAPAELLQLMNDAILRTARRRIMMTCGVTLVDPKSLKVTLASAGQNFPYHVQKSGIRPIVTVGQPLGETETVEYPIVELTLEPGDLLIWFTDGLVEAENEWGEQLGEKRLRSFCQKFHGKPANVVRNEILAMLEAFRGGQAHTDDVTTVVIGATA